MKLRAIQVLLLGTLSCVTDDARETRHPLRSRIETCQALESVPLSPDDVLSIGRTLAADRIERGGGALPDGPRSLEIRDYVGAIGRTLAATPRAAALSWTYEVLNSQVPGATSAPGGYVMVTRGLLMQAKTEAELAGVLAHEMGHVLQRDGVQQFARARARLCKMNVGAEVAATTLAAVSGAAINADDASSTQALDARVSEKLALRAEDALPRHEELEADRTALELLTGAGYDPRAYARFLAAVPAIPFHPPAADRIPLFQGQPASGLRPEVSVPAFVKAFSEAP